jgi:hypothetical protein
MKDAVHVFRYLAGTMDLAIVFKGKGDLVSVMSMLTLVGMRTPGGAQRCLCMFMLFVTCVS